MGHALGSAHTGNHLWSFDGAGPTMGPDTRVADWVHSAQQETLAQDDESLAQWGYWKQFSGGRFFSYDPSFEGGFGHWGQIESSSGDVVLSTAASEFGDYSVLISEFEAGVYVTSVFDPWLGCHNEGCTLPAEYAPGMDPSGDGRHLLQAHTRHRRKNGAGGGIQAGYRYAYISYDPTDWKGTSPSIGMFTSYVTRTCSITSGIWKTCKKGRVFDFDDDPDNETAVAFRTRFIASNDPVYIDRSGARRRNP